jgi:hypothetical protein
MELPRLILLNGVSSSGRTNIAHLLQERLDILDLNFSIDSVLYPLPPSDLRAMMEARDFRASGRRDNLCRMAPAKLEARRGNLIRSRADGPSPPYQSFIPPPLARKRRSPIFAVVSRRAALWLGYFGDGFP